MGGKTPQTFANHTRIDPLFHYVLLPLFALHFFASGWKVVRQPGVDTAWMLVVALAALVAVFKIRLYALRVQDRVIRLEERLRLSQLTPEPLRSRIDEFSEAQLVGLRFASDAEIPRLVEKTLAHKLSQADIKKAIAQWRPDYFRV